MCDGRGRPVLLRLTAGQTSDYKGAAMMVEALPAAKTMLADRDTKLEQRILTRLRDRLFL